MYNNINIKDIAAASGFSITTISRVLNEHPDVNEKTRLHVLDVIRTYGYIPNNNAKHLKQNYTRNIAVIIKGKHNTLFTYIFENLQYHLNYQGYTVLIHYIGQDDDEIKTALQLCKEKKPAGIIFLGGNITNFKENFAYIKIPCVLATTYAESLNFNNLSSVSIDDFLGGYTAIDFLLSYGHKKIAIIGYKNSFLSMLRLDGCIKRLEKEKIKFDNKLYINAVFNIRDSYLKTTKFLEKGILPTAIFAVSDVMAIGATKAVFDFGLHVPNDISIFGFDGIEMTEFYNPAITTLKQPTGEISFITSNIIIDAIENNGKSKHILCQLQIKEGDSVRKI